MTSVVTVDVQHSGANWIARVTSVMRGTITSTLPVLTALPAPSVLSAICLLPVLPALTVLSASSVLSAQQTVAERTGNTATSRSTDVLAFIDSLQRRGAGLRVGTLGTSIEGRRIPFVVAARPQVSSPAEAHRSGKPVIWLQANIHAGEVEGKEATQMLLRDLTVGSLRPLLDSVVLLVVPIYNTDGNDAMGPASRNRPGQNGPDPVGRGTNGQGLNLNRDYVKAEAPETQGALALINQWEPDLFIDLHTTNGSYHGYALTYAPGLNPNDTPANAYVRDRFLPEIRERMRKRHNFETFPYGNFRNQTPDSLIQGWETYDARPRFGTNSTGLRGKLAILSEGYSNDPFERRIAATYAFVREILSLMAAEAPRVRRLVAESVSQRPGTIAVRSRLAPPTEQPVIAEITEADSDGAGPFARRRRTGVMRTIRMPVYDRFEAERTERRPVAYFIPPAFPEVVALLRRQGVLVERLATQWRGNAERFRIDSVRVEPIVFEGHRAVTIEGAWEAASARDIPSGTFLVRTDQPLGTFAAYVLEAASEDGVVTWNLMDRGLSTRSGYPIMRTFEAVNVERVELN